MSNPQKLIVIVGPTASGKSDIAVLLAKKINGEIISADSRQVFRGMDIGTGKITKREMKGIPHYMLDVVKPWNTYSASRYKKLGEKIIKEIIKKGKTPIICGGTGHYIEALVEGLVIPNVKINKQLRNKLEKKTPAELHAILKKIDPKRAITIDPKNPRRLVRAIEIATELGSVPEKKYIPPPYQTIWFGVLRDPQILRERIHVRLIKRIKQGMIKEIKMLHDGVSGKVVSWKRLDDFGLEYRYVSRYLRGMMTKEKMIDELEREINAYAKRQMTWFKRNKSIHWIHDEKEINKILNNI